jgi:hypothetical protein
MMMNLKDVMPFEGLGDLRFGMPRDTVRELLGAEYQSFRKTPSSPQLTDSYAGLGFHLYYYTEDRLEFIETFPPCDSTYSGVRLLKGSRQRVLQQLADLGHTALYEDGGYDFKELGLALCTPVRKIESVAVYRRGYYDD